MKSRLARTLQFFTHILLVLSVLFTLGAISGSQNQVQAACPAGYVCEGDCGDVGIGGCSTSGRRCVTVPGGGVTRLSAVGAVCGGGKGAAIMGGINFPSTPGKSWFQFSEIRITEFISLLLRILTIISGLWFMFNMIYAGYLFLASAGDTAVFGKFKESLYYSLIGLFVIAVAYLLAGLIGAIFFGDAGFIIRPTLYQASGATTP